MLLTGRLSSWSGRVEPLELDVLAVDNAAAFLLARTDARRRKTPTDAADARPFQPRSGFTPQPRVAQRTLGYEPQHDPKSRRDFTTHGNSTTTAV